MPATYTLVHNYRSHRGVLALAAAVVEVVYEFFPGAIDRLEPDQGLFDGPKPKLLLTTQMSHLTVRRLELVFLLLLSFFSFFFFRSGTCTHLFPLG